MSELPPQPSTQQPSSWVYDGIWGMLTGVFCVPRHAPTLPAMDVEDIVARKPSAGFMSYLKFQYWLVVIVTSVGLAITTIATVVASENAWFLLLFGLLGMLLVATFLLSFLTIHLRYDTTWYVFSDRSMRLRRGIWIIQESTITFDNVQNVKVTQGPLQRYFGIANVVVETAGGGGSNNEPGGGLGLHAGLIEGVAEAPAIRDSIMGKVRAANHTGLGDETSNANLPMHWSPQHLSVLREIRNFAHQAEKR